MTHYTVLTIKQQILLLKTSLSIVLTVTDQKPQKIIKKMILLSITLTFRRCDGGNYHLFNDFCVFWSVAVNTVDKLQFLVLISITPAHCSAPIPRSPAPRSAAAPPYFAMPAHRCWLHFFARFAHMLWLPSPCTRRLCHCRQHRLCHAARVAVSSYAGYVKFTKSEHRDY